MLDNLIEVRQNAQPSGSNCTGGQLRTFEYDSLSRLIEANNPESSTITYSYDNNGNLDLRTDARGITTNHDYDALNRITLKSYSDTAAPNPTPWVDYTYGTTAPNIGRLTRVHSGGMSTDYTYHTLGRVISSTQTTNQAAYPFSYEYNLDDSLESITYPSSDEVTYGYDTAGRLTSVNGVIQTQPKSYLAAASYAPHGAAAQMTLGNSRIERACFNSRLQPVQIALGTTQLTGPSDCAIQGPDLLHLEFYYGTSNNNGNVLSHKIARPGFFDEQHYRYDGVNRLAIATEGATPSNDDCPGGAKWCRDYAYDPFGNRAIDGNTGPTLPQATPTSLGAFSTASNRLSAAGYDNAGNLTGHTGLAQEILYDAENRMVEFSGPSGLQREGSYAYDGGGRRVLAASTIAGTATTTAYVYDAFGNLAAEYSTQAPSNPGTYYRTTDHLGSTRLITKADGMIDEEGGCLDFYPFGEQIESGAGNRSSVLCYGGVGGLTHKFTGKEHDDESNLDYFGARYFSPPLGRFMGTDDPLLDQSTHNPQSWNLYSYVTNAPMNYTDPTGRCKEREDEKYHDSEEGPCVDPEDVKVTVSEDAPRTRDEVAEVKAEQIRLQYTRLKRFQEGKKDLSLSPRSRVAAKEIHSSLAVLPTVCSVTVAGQAGAPGGRIRIGGEYNTDRGFATRGRAQGGVGPINLRTTLNSNGNVSTDIRVGGLYGATLGFSGVSITSVGATANLGKLASLSVSGQIGTSYACPTGDSGHTDTN